MKATLPRTFLPRYGASVLAVVAALFLTVQIDYLAERMSLALLFVAIVFATWYGGRGPGIAAIVLSVLGGEYFVILPRYSFDLSSNAVYPLITFVPLTFLIILLLSALQQRARSLQSSEKRYRLLFDNNPMPMWVFERETLKFLAINEAAINHYGYSKEEFLSMSLTDIRPAEDHTALIEDVTRKDPPRKSFGIWRHLKKDGGLIDVEITAHELKFEGKPARLVLSNDITERKRAENLLRENEARLQTIVENLTEGLVVSDLEGNVIHFNKAAIEMHGFKDLDECLLHLNEFESILEFRDLDGQIIPLEEWPLARVLRGEQIHNVEVAVKRTGQDRERIFNYGGTLIREPDGNPFLALLLISDITGRKQAVQNLLDSERRFRALIEHSGDSISLINAENKILYLSPSVAKVEGYDPAELVGTNGMENTHPDDIDRVEKVVAELVARPGEPVPVLWRRRHKAGHWIWLEGVATNLLGDPAVNAIVTNYRDVTARRQAEEEVRRLNATLEQRVQQRTMELEAANKELEAFSYSVSHDLRAPLRHINGFSMALMEDYQELLDETGKGYIQEVRGASQEMGQLIDDVLQLARVARSEMKREKMDLSEIATDILMKLKKRGPERSVKFRVEEGLTCYGDRRLLGIVLTNLLGNAWKFSEKRQDAEIVFGGGPENGEDTFFVKDNGAGFDMAYADKLYGAFQRLHSVNEFEGTGIGLATVQRIIHRHGGRVWAEGEIDKGATFFFALPGTGDFENEE